MTNETLSTIPLETHEQADENETLEAFRRDVLAGLSATPKTLPCKYLYDEPGSELFDRICELPEYYPTRTEHKIMADCLPELVTLAGPKVQVVEYGSGSGIKTRMLLNTLHTPTGCTLIEIAAGHLDASAHRLAAEFPEIDILPVCADYTKAINLPPLPPDTRRRVAFFPGSTIGNFVPGMAADFLSDVAETVGSNGALIIGVDLRKEKSVLEAAYDDSAGVTAEFNKNLLHRINRELDGDLPVDDFKHESRYNSHAGRVEMHLVAMKPVNAQIGDAQFAFEQGESIHTENSYKYTVDGFAEMADDAGWRVREVWMDPEELFSVQYLVVE